MIFPKYVHFWTEFNCTPHQKTLLLWPVDSPDIYRRMVHEADSLPLVCVMRIVLLKLRLSFSCVFIRPYVCVHSLM